MKANELVGWPVAFHPDEWPEGTLDRMDATVMTKAIWPLRALANIPMWPSKLVAGHVRTSGSTKSQHYAVGRLSTATDMHVSSLANMLKVMEAAETISDIGGIGIYFDTNTPMLHLDVRSKRLTWLRTKDGKYVYKENDIIKFYVTLGEQLCGQQP